MTGRIPDDTLQAIRERVSIVEVVSGYVSLKRAGRNHLGLCPFHNEKTPSFTVNDERGLFHCFGCGAGGTVFTFVMQADHVGFREAVEGLARRANIELPRTAGNEEGERKRNALMEINAFAQQYFSAALKSAQGAGAREYLRRRGLSLAVIDRYGIGFCPATGGLSKALAGRGNAVANALDVGLVGRRSDGSLYERFRGRVMFPIRDSAGRVVGFGGRTLGNDQPKYLNSPESSLFRKGSVLYGLFEARQAIRDAGRIILVEGYVDALALVQNGIAFAVATLGTALGVSQLRLGRRFAPEMIAFFDGDRAGRDAAARAFTTCVQAEVWGLAAFLPDGFDPDTFVQKQGAAATLQLLDNAVPLADFFLERIAPSANATVPQRARAARSAAEVLSLVKDAAQFDLLARSAAQRLGVDESFFREMRQDRGRLSAGDTLDAAVARDRETEMAEVRPEDAALVESAILDKSAAVLVRDSGVLELLDDRRLVEALIKVIRQWECGGDPSSVLPSIPPSLCARITAALLGQGPIAAEDRMKVVRDCIGRIKNRSRRSEVTALRAKLRCAEASGDDQAYLTELRRVDEALRRRSSPPD